MYSVSPVIITEKMPLYSYCEEQSRLAKNLYNAALFRIRQIFTASGKDHLTENEQEVMEEVRRMTEAGYPAPGKVISYHQLDRLLRITENPDYFSGLPMQSAEAVIKQAVTDFKGWLSALADHREHPEKYLGRPKMPGYRKADGMTFAITNQDAVLKEGSLKLPKTKLKLPVSHLKNTEGRLKEVKLIPYYGKYIISLTFECADVPLRTDLSGIAAIDFGTDNFAAIVSSDHASRIYKGGAVLSGTRHYAQERAKAVGIITKGHEHMHADSRHLARLSYRHACFVRDQMHKLSRSIIGYCLEHECGTLVLGTNRNWKQGADLGAANNQKFVQMPITGLREQILYKAAAKGIRVILQEESYTSRADVTACDAMPVYGQETETPVFSGKRIKRGLYQCHDCKLINADCNGAANICRKAFPAVWEGCRDYGFLASPEVYGFHELNPKSIPVKRIAAV